MRQLQLRRSRLLQLLGRVHDPPERAALQIEAQFGRSEHAVERPAIANVQCDRPEVVGDHHGVAREGERGHAGEADPPGPAILDLGPRRH